jgi:hypothetical protein
VIRDSLSPGQEEKWPRRMAQRNVEMDGLKAQPCKKAASSLFICLLRIMLFARCCFVELEYSLRILEQAECSKVRWLYFFFL